VLLPDAIIVLISEVLVDWGKHAFVLKFNEILADVYGEFKVKLALDMASSQQSQVRQTSVLAHCVEYVYEDRCLCKVKTILYNFTFSVEQI